MAKVLLIEDDPLVVKMYRNVLSFEGFKMETSPNGAEGLQKAKEFKPDLIFLDIMMPKMNGIEVLEKLKKDPEMKNIPVIMLTNLAGADNAEEALKKGAFAYMVKSEYKPKEVAEKAKEFFSRQDASVTQTQAVQAPASNTMSQNMTQQVTADDLKPSVGGMPPAIKKEENTFPGQKSGVDNTLKSGGNSFVKSSGDVKNPSDNNFSNAASSSSKLPDEGGAVKTFDKVQSEPGVAPKAGEMNSTTTTKDDISDTFGISQPPAYKTEAVSDKGNISASAMSSQSASSGLDGTQSTKPVSDEPEPKPPIESPVVEKSFGSSVSQKTVPDSTVTPPVSGTSTQTPLSGDSSVTPKQDET